MTGAGGAMDNVTAVVATTEQVLSEAVSVYMPACAGVTAVITALAVVAVKPAGPLHK
jgi:acyl CoA:acetate/3-ketoacid CoA transferase beta subunit